MKIKTSLITAGVFALAALPSGLALADDANTKRFKSLDVDSDGHITRAEFAAGARAKFERLDTNGDGIITAAEMYPDQEANKLKAGGNAGAQAPSPTGKLGPADQNADGQISRAEYEADADLQFDLLDTDKSGFLTEKELAAAPKEMKPDK